MFKPETYLQLAVKRTLNRKSKLPKLLAPPSSKALERQYLRQILPYLESINSLIEVRLLSRLPQIFNEFYSSTGKKMDAASDDLKEIFKQIRGLLGEEWTPEALQRLAMRQGLTINEFNKKYAERNLKKVLGVDLFLRDSSLGEQLSLFSINNAQLIESMGEAAIQKVETLTYVSMQQGKRVEELAKEIKAVSGRNGITMKKAKMIARDQTAKLNADITRSRQTELGIDKYVWRTVGDERVRDNHRSKDGEIFSWDDPPADTGHPGEDYQCRCVAEPYLQDLIPETDD